MMGHQGSVQDKLFYSFSLDDHVPQSHLLRGIDRCLDLSKLRAHLADHYSHTGRPSIDPELMLRMLVVGYCYGIRSERRLCEEVQLNLAYRWFCRLGLEDQIPDHSTFSKNRLGRFRESGTLRWLFDEVLRQCMSKGLVKGEGFATDASIVAADASGQHKAAVGQKIDWSDEASRSRAVREYLDALNEPLVGQPEARQVSLTDPQSRFTGATGGMAFFAYSTNYLVDTANGIIMDVEASQAHRPGELEATRNMVERVEETLGLKPARLIADTAYGSAPMLAWMKDKQIEPHVPVWDKSGRKDGSLQVSDFQWDAVHDEYRCPEGKALRSRRRVFRIERSVVTSADTILYHSAKSDCDGCALKPMCCPNTPTRKIARSIHEDAREIARRVATTEQYKVSRRQRKKVEVLFAHLKRILKLDRLRLRGMSGARDEFTLAAAVQNLRRMAKLAMASEMA